jgi:predicted dehydrogenase
MEYLSRRSFLHKVGIGAGAATLVTLHSVRGHDMSMSNDGKKLNIALVGLGRYAGYLAEGIAVSQYCKVAGIVTGTPAKAVEWSKRYGIAQANIYDYQNFDKIANNKDIDLVYVVLPNSMHKEFTIRAAKAGKHVIVEKPMAMSASECEEMIDVCHKAKVQLAVGYRLHYEPYNM